MLFKSVSLLIAAGLLLFSNYAAAHPVNIEAEFCSGLGLGTEEGSHSRCGCWTKNAVDEDNAAEGGRYWETSGYFEGDIVFAESQFRNGRLNGGKPARFLTTTIPVEFDPALETGHRDIIRRAFTEYHNKTCIRFKETDDRDPKEDHIYIRGDYPGCSAMVGRIGGRQFVNLAISKPGTGCYTHGAVVHELLHSLGFFHQQSSTDRDEYVTIMWNNIQKGTEHNFLKYNDKEVTSFGVEYDYGSIMHYGPTAFSINGQPTIVPKKAGVSIGQLNGLSAKDIKKLHLMYNCPVQGYSADDVKTDLKDFLTDTEQLI